MNYLIKKTLLFTIPLVFSACIFDSDDDVEPWNAEKVCPTEGMNAYGMPNRGTFTDERDGNVYRYTTIGNQVWMAENLRYDAQYSMCSNDDSFIKQYCELIEHNCDTKECCKESLCHNFGRYYSIIGNGNRFGLIDSVLADTICPKGWHIPTKEEWKILENAMKASDDNNSDVANRMKSADTIFFSISKLYPNEHDRTLAGTDNCALNILPSGFMYEGGETLKFRASILSSTQKNSDFVYVVVMGNTVEYISNVYRNSIRCVMDSANLEL
ncbi:MAG: hypothetical protein J5615_01550 [Fibrobacter sp.]|nr:hypothetical protein [Fibrobacter sp.]